VVVIGHDRHDLERTVDPLFGGALGRFASALTPAPTDAAPQPTSGHSCGSLKQRGHAPVGTSILGPALPLHSYRRRSGPSFAPRASLRGRTGALGKYAWNTR